MDYRTLYVETWVLPKGSAAEVAKFFVANNLLRKCAPEFPITDSGTMFKADLTQAILKYIQTVHRGTTASHPQMDGLNERLNETLANAGNKWNVGNKWIVVVTDYLTRYAETGVLPKGSAAEVAKFFVENIVLRHSDPEVLITD